MVMFFLLSIFAISNGTMGKDAENNGTRSRTPDDRFTTAENWEAFNAGNIGGLNTKGYFGAAFDGRYVYYVPCRMANFHGTALRYDTQGDFKNAASWESFDASGTDSLDMVGFAGAVFDGRYIYYIPFSDANSRHGRVLRFDTEGDFDSSSSWDAYDAGMVGGTGTKGYNGAVFDGRYIYLTPFGYDPFAHGRVLRYDTEADFKTAGSWIMHDAKNTDGLDTRGYYGSTFDGRYVYFTAFHNGTEFHGRMLRYDTQGAFDSAGSWDAYDANNTDSMTTIGYKGAIYDGRYVYYVPFRDGEFRHGRVLRYDTEGDFDASGSWDAFDAGNTDGLDTRGFVGAERDDRYIYFIPYSGDNNVFHGRAIRYDTEGDFESAESWTGFDVNGIDGLTCKGYKYGTSDGRYLYFAPYENGPAFSGIALRYDTKVPAAEDILDPVANAGVDKWIDQGISVSFNASGSTDNIAIVNYTWTFTDVDEKILYGPATNYTFDNAGSFVVSLNVSDAAENWNTDTMTVNVMDTTSPTAIAGEDLVAGLNAEITFDGSDSTDNVGVENYTWTFNYNGSEINLYEEIATFVFAKSGNYRITLKVADHDGNLGIYVFWVNVTGETDTVNPVSDAGADKTAMVGSHVSLDGSASTDNIGINKWTWTFTYNGTERVLSGKTASFIFDIVGNYSITLVVTDAFGNSDTDTMWVNVTQAITADTVAPVAKGGNDRTVDAGTLVQFDGTGSTDNVGIVNWTWTFTYDGAEQKIYGEKPSFRFDIAGNYSLTFSVLDEAGNHDESNFTVQVKEAKPQPFTLGPFMDKDGNPVEGLDVTMTIAGKAYTVKTDENGKATFHNTPSPQNDDKVVVKQNGEVVFEGEFSGSIKSNSISDPEDPEGFLSKVPWLWVAVGAGALLLIIIIIIVVKKRRDDDYDDDDDDDDYGEFIETKACHKCGDLLPTFDTKFCQECGEDQDPFIGPTVTIEEKLCVKCYVPVLPPDSPFCQNCGANQQSIAERKL